LCFSAFLGYFKKPKNFLKSNFEAPVLALIVHERCLTTILSEIMQSIMRNATPQLNKQHGLDVAPTNYQLRPSDHQKLASSAPTNSRRPGQRSALGLHSSLFTPSQAHNHYYESMVEQILLQIIIGYLCNFHLSKYM